MDICSRCGESVSEEVHSLHDLKQSSVNQKIVGDLGNTLNEFLQIQDAQKSTCSSIPPYDMDDVCDIEGGDICDVLEIRQTKFESATSMRSLCKCATFPCSDKMSSAESTDGEDETPGTAMEGDVSVESMNPAYLRSTSLPTPLKLVSAMKGSREKQGTSPKKLTVTWAPEVYDPPTTSLSHSVKKKQQRTPKTEKRNGKHKQKGKSPRGSSSGKDKKQFRKFVGSSDKCFKSLDYNDRLVSGNFDESYDELVDFDVGSPDSNCGSSFLRTSLTKVHFSFAEAT